MLKNRPFLIAVMALAVIGGISTVIFLEETISVSDRAEAENTNVSTVQTLIEEECRESVKVLNKPLGISRGVHTYTIDLPIGSSFTNFVGDNALREWKLTMGDYVNADIGTVTS